MARVCMVVFNFYAFDARARREAEALVARGDEVDCICLGRRGTDKRNRHNGVNFYFWLTDKYRGTKLGAYISQHILFFLFAFFMVLRLHYRKPYDLIQVNTLPDYLVFTAALPKLLGAKVILDVRELVPEMYMAKFGVTDNNWIVRFLTWVERISIAFADKAIAVHELQLEALVRHGNPRNKFLILLNVPDSKVFDPHVSPRRSQQRKFTLVYHGTITLRNGIDIALRAVAIARQEIPELEFLVIGGGDGFGAAVELSKQLGLQMCVKFVESVPMEQLPKMIAEADLGVIPYPRDEFTRYMLPAKLMEYATIGIPAITSRLEAIERYFDDGMVRFVEPGNVADLAGHIVQLYRDPEERARLASAVKRFTDECNWDQQKLQYFDCVDSLLSPRVSRVSGELA